MGTPTTHRVEAPGVRTWRWVAAVLAVSQLVAPAVANVLAGNFLESGATNEALITPAGYAFGSWGVITVLCAITAVAVVRYGLGAWWEKSLLVSACVVFVGFCMWLLVAAQDWLWLSVVVFVVMVSALIHILRLLVLRRHDLSCSSWLAVLATVTFGLYLGWSSVAGRHQCTLVQLDRYLDGLRRGRGGDWQGHIVWGNSCTRGLVEAVKMRSDVTLWRCDRTSESTARLVRTD